MTRLTPFRALLGASLLFLLASATQSAAISNEDHQRYLRQYPEYAAADRELNEAWAKFKSVATKKHFAEMLEEQRNWLKQKDKLVVAKRGNDEVYAETAARVMRERTAIINSSICAYVRDYVTVSMKATPWEDREGEPCLLVRPVGSRPVDVENYEGFVYGKTRYPQLEKRLLDEFEKIRRSYDDGLLARHKSAMGLTYTEDYDSYASHICDAKRDTFVIGFENDRVSCVSHFTEDWFGDNPHKFQPCDTIVYDARQDKFIKAEELFEHPATALNIIKGIALTRNDTINDNDIKDFYDPEYQFKRVLISNDIIKHYELNKVSIINGCFAVDIRQGDNWTYFNLPKKEYRKYTILVDMKDLVHAGLKMEYFR